MSHVFGPSVTVFYRVSQKVSDVIPVLRLTPIGTQPSAVSVFLSVAKCGGLQSHIFAFWRFLSDISATLARIHTKYYLCMDNVCRRAPSPCGAHRPLGGGGRGS